MRISFVVRCKGLLEYMRLNAIKGHNLCLRREIKDNVSMARLDWILLRVKLRVNINIV